ncbi:MAG TPA: class III cytochrome C family protein [Bacteroidia bacterium]|nr:class III cytochrome C family protein [Bacteroidia bacterium]
MKKALVYGIIVVCIGLMYQFPHTMLNPGELVEGHQELNSKCLSCHTPFKGLPNEKCITCHKLSEIGKDSLKPKGKDEKILFHQNLSDQECTTCHTDHKGLKPGMSISKFSHEILSITDFNKCNSCHVQPADSLHKPLSTDCKSCHNTKGWKADVVFDHEMIQGAAKNNCSSCHKVPDDTFHHSFKDNCDKCHTTSKWKPSTFDHSNYFVLDKDHNAECITCHTNNNFKAYTCYGCHEHSESKIRSEHIEEGINNFTNCVSCHKSADEHDIRMNGRSNQELNQKDAKNVKDYIKSGKKEGKKEHDDD